MFFKKKEHSSCGSPVADRPVDAPVQSGGTQDFSFPPDHPLSALCALWSGTDHLDTPLCFPVLSDENCPMSEELLSREREHLQRLLTMGAIARLKEIAAAAPAVDVDEQALILLSRDEMMAWACLLPPVGQGSTLTTPQLCKRMVEQGVSHGLNWSLLRSLPARSGHHFQLFPVAWGTPPVAGRDGYIVDRYPRSENGAAEADGQEPEDCDVQNAGQSIAENQVICEIVPPTSGTRGMTATGKYLPADDGKAAAVPQGRNTRISEDGRYLLAAQGGHVVFSQGAFQVRSMLHIQAEDLQSTPNLQFSGDVHIHCDLNRDNTIRATGSVQVDGVMEGCTIEAGENIIVSNGVLGQDTAILHAQRNVYAKYLENCIVLAGEHVQADCIINSTVYSNGTVEVRTGRGSIIGGTIWAARRASAAVVGSKAERPTSIILGGDPCKEAERIRLQEELQDITHMLSHRTEWSAGQTASDLQHRQRTVRAELERLDKELDGEQSPAISYHGCKFLCDIGYPGTQVTIGHSIYTIDQEERHCTVGFSGGCAARL